jgi:succinate dehydrogenase / fumarate reductase cytochrome b subunit
VATEQSTTWTRNYFLLKRIHSLSGIIPIGVFLTIHLTINATILHGGQAYQTAVDGLHLLGRVGLLTAVEVVFIFVPILFHAVLGVQIWWTGKMNVAAHPYGGNIRYTLQRITGLIAFAFIIYHLWHVHWLGAWFGGGEFDPHHAAETTAQALAPWYLRCIYGVGVLAAVFHFANGVWTFLITWGITIGPRSQTWVGYVCAAFGIVLGVVGLGSLRGFGDFVPETTRTQLEQPVGPVTAEQPDVG